MSETKTDRMAAEDKPLSPLLLFSAKVAIATVAILVILYGAVNFITSSIEDTGQLGMLKGGPVFWAKMEGKLYKLADEPDLPPEKKQKILNALRKLSVKYKPYLDAVASESSAGDPKK